MYWEEGEEGLAHASELECVAQLVCVVPELEHAEYGSHMCYMALVVAANEQSMG